MIVNDTTDTTDTTNTINQINQIDPINTTNASNTINTTNPTDTTDTTTTITTSIIKIEPTKTYWCRDARAFDIVKIIGFVPFHKGFNMRKCSYPNCRGAHCLEEIKTIPHIHKWNHIDKSKYNFADMFVNIVSVINRDKSKVFPFSFFNEQISKVSTMNFIEVLQLWHDLSCHYRKIVKELPKKREWKSPILPLSHTSGYVFADDVPCFYLDNKFEDNAWAFDRITRFCNTHKTFKDKIAKHEHVTIREICLGEVNCKEGIHRIYESICVKDFLEGKCSCMTKEEFNSEKETLQKEINNLQKIVNLPKSNKHKDIIDVINNKRYKLNNLERSIHYTDYGMKSWNAQWAEYIIQVEEENKKAEEEKNKRIKPTWDHNMIKTEQCNVGKVSKLSLNISKK